MKLNFYKKITPYLNNIFAAAIAVTFVLSLSACGTLSLSFSPNSSHSTSFIKGELTSRINQNLESVWKAVQKVADQSQFQVKSSRIDAFSAVLKCEDAQMRKIEITLEKEAPTLTRVRIRVGLLGDAEFSNQLFDQIRNSL